MSSKDSNDDPSSKLEQELAAAEERLAEVNREVEKLLKKKEYLETKCEILKLQLDESTSSVSAVDWDKTDYPWSEELMEKIHSSFKIEKLRPYQLAAMNATMSDKDCILIMPTGGGKSLCFQAPALVSQGITLVVSPLVSLMEDQIMKLHSLGLPAAMWSASSSKDEANDIQKDMLDDKSSLKILYVTPEKVAKSKRFMAKLEKMYSMDRFSRLAIDEVHCCSQWGHDFRPDYKFLGIMKRQFPKVPIIGLTATATTSVIADVQKMLNIERCLVLRSCFNRPNLKYEVHIKPTNNSEMIDELENLLKNRFNGLSGIIYCFSIKESEEISKDLRKRDIRAECYHAVMQPDARSKVHKLWSSNELQVVVATIAFGMGIDKPDVKFVIHHSMSKSMENYYQESGRAGRDDEPASCILFYRFADIFRQSTMVFTEQTGLDNLYAMVRYCLEIKNCRRSVIAQHFGENWEPSDCNEMCDICCAKEKINTEEVDVTKYCLTLYKILDHASNQDERLTFLKVLDIWQGGKGLAKLKPPGLEISSMSKEKCSRIMALLLINNYLKEEFHFTPYATISYIQKGPRSGMVSEGKHKAIITMSTKKRKYEDIPVKSSHNGSDIQSVKKAKDSGEK